MLTVEKLTDGHKNLKVRIRGILDQELEMTPVLKDLPHVTLRSALWLIQEKLGLILWWNKDELIMPMESRNSIRLDQGWDPPKKGWSGEVFISSFNMKVGPMPKHFVIELDFDK